MLKIEKKIVEATCDACGKDLRYLMDADVFEATKEFNNDPVMSTNYAEIIPKFGYGSNLDPIGGFIVPHYHLCEDCFAKAMHAVGLPVEDLDPVICPVCRKPRNGKDDHPECMRDWYPHPDSEPQRETREKMDAHEKAWKKALEAGTPREGERGSPGGTPGAAEAAGDAGGQ